MHGPNHDPEARRRREEARRQLRNRLIEEGIDPKEFFDSEMLGADHGGEHAETVPRTFARCLDSIDAWRRIWAHDGPETTGYDHHYHIAWCIVEWSEEANGWVTVQTGDPNPAGAYGVDFGDYDRVAVDDFGEYLENREADTPPVGLTLTDVERETLPEAFDLIVNRLTEVYDVRVEAWPNRSGDRYEVTWEVVDWHGTPGDGEWQVVSLD